jgi:hypothetical protein
MMQGMEAALRPRIPETTDGKVDIMKSNGTKTRVFSAIIVAIGVFSFGTANAAEPEPKPGDATQTKYVVVRGDTLWSISARFLKEPQRWQEIWRLNQTLIKDPDLIHPGYVITLNADAKNSLEAQSYRNSELSHFEYRSPTVPPKTEFQARSSKFLIPVQYGQILKYDCMMESRLPVLVPLNCYSPALRLGMVFR